MKTFDFQLIEVAPQSEDFRLYPDFLVSHLVKLGIGVIEANRESAKQELVDLIYTSSETRKSQVIASIGTGFFRPLLARLGPRFGASEMLYSGHTLFACEAECAGQKRIHRFSLFVCNHPVMGTWMKLYLYLIDGLEPVRKEIA